MRSPRKEESRRGGDGLAMGTGETSGVTARVAGVCVACGRAACVVWELWEGEGEVLAGGGCRGGVAAPAVRFATGIVGRGLRPEGRKGYQAINTRPSK